jgi:hypothetical protein
MANNCSPGKQFRLRVSPKIRVGYRIAHELRVWNLLDGSLSSIAKPGSLVTSYRPSTLLA